MNATPGSGNNAPAISGLPYQTYQDILAMRQAVDAGITALNSRGQDVWDPTGFEVRRCGQLARPLRRRHCERRCGRSTGPKAGRLGKNRRVAVTPNPGTEFQRRRTVGGQLRRAQQMDVGAKLGRRVAEFDCPACGTLTYIPDRSHVSMMG
jgi:hypothetical protein